jgi:Family of unknown function (DUF6788)
MPKRAAVEELERRREGLRTKLTATAEMRPGSLVGRYRRCGKANCHCAAQGAAGHGPSWSLTRVVGGKTVTRIIPESALARTRQQIAEYRAFRDLSREFVEVNEKLCDARLGAERAQAEAEKGGSSKPSQPRSSPKSRR